MSTYVDLVSGNHSHPNSPYHFDINEDKATDIGNYLLELIQHKATSKIDSYLSEEHGIDFDYNDFVFSHEINTINMNCLQVNDLVDKILNYISDEL